jgi:hypothetical protein
MSQILSEDASKSCAIPQQTQKNRQEEPSNRLRIKREERRNGGFILERRVSRRPMYCSYHKTAADISGGRLVVFLMRLANVRDR